MAYIFYFLGYVSMFKLSQNLATEKEPFWYHVVVAILWPMIVVLAMCTELYNVVMNIEE